jgi:hypothetical protein
MFHENVKNARAHQVGMIRFSGDKTPVVFTMEQKKKPSIPLGRIIKILVIVKLAVTILQLLLK